MTGALALACFVKVCGVVFLGAPRSEAAAHAHESGPAMRGRDGVAGRGVRGDWPRASRLLAGGVAGGGCMESRLGRSANARGAVRRSARFMSRWRARAGWRQSGLWRRVRRGSLTRAVTWDCGYALPDARGCNTPPVRLPDIITEWFAWILRPVRHEHRPAETLPVSANFSEHTPETVLEYAVEPAGGVVMQLSQPARRLQHGRVQSYLLYLLIGSGGAGGRRAARSGQITI